MTPRVLDVTLRDGGYVNDWSFSTLIATRIVAALAREQIPYIEVGYYRPQRVDDQRGASCCSQAYLTSLSGVSGAAKLGVMVHPASVQLDQYGLLTASGVTFVRLVVAGSDLACLEPHVTAAHHSGLICSINLIRASERSLESIATLAIAAADIGADWLYVADSNGSMFPRHVANIVTELTRVVRIPVGFHAHDPLHLAFANSLAALNSGVSMLDSSLAGLGKGGGNLVTELITAYLKRISEPCGSIANLAAVASETLKDWIAPGHGRRCQSATAALLDLNADDLARLPESDRNNQSILIELERRLDERVQAGRAGGVEDPLNLDSIIRLHTVDN